MAEKTQDELFEAAIQMIGGIAKLPVIRVDREEFLRKQFADSDYLDQVLELGPQAVFKPEALRRRADKIIMASTTMSSASSFLAGLPSNPVAMVAAGGADVAQYFGFAINLAQQLAYLYGEDDLFKGTAEEVPEEVKMRILAYLGVMLGASGASALINQTSKTVGANLGKKVAAKPLMQTIWYPVVKKVGALVGQTVTKKSLEKTITKIVPVIGGAISGAVTFVTFRPMGDRLADVLERNLRGEFDIMDDLADLDPEFLARLRAEGALS